MVMKLNSPIALVVLFAACNSAPSAPATAPAKTDSAVAVKKINSPYEIMYSSNFVIDDPKNAETLLALWKVYDNGDLSAGKDMIADSMEMYMGNGARIHTSRDSAIAMVQAVRSSYKSAVDRVDAVMALKSVDKNEHWALIWGTEVDTHKDGKVDSTELHEVWRFNSAGKADLIMQYTRPAAPPAPPKKK
jgi:hypothetical protein